MKTFSVYLYVLQWKGNKTHSNFEKANVFNNYFCSVFGPATQITTVLSNNSSIILSTSSAAVSEVKNMLKECDENLPAGSDNISAFILHYCASFLASLVHSISQCIVDSGTWPDERQTATILPLNKNGSIWLAQNYRPISILVKLSLVFEHMLFRYILLLVRAQICSSQHGFIKRRCTLSFVSIVSIARECFRLRSMFWFQKRIWPCTSRWTTDKTFIFSVRRKFLLLYEFYLSNRRQCVKLKQNVSELKNVTSGVPQGSVLGPLFFTLFNNDISDNLQYTKSLLYADDLKTRAQIFSSAFSIQLNSDINCLTLGWWQKDDIQSR